MGEIKNGGPAFPCIAEQVLDATGADFVGVIDHGMSLRDYFAAAALPAAIAEMGRKIEATRKICGERSIEILAATMAYEIADAMIEARDRGDGNG